MYPQLTLSELEDLIYLLQDMVDDELDNPDVQEWVPILDKLKFQAILSGII